VKQIIAAAALLALSACATTAVRPTCPDRAAADYYFEKGALDRQSPELDKHASRWISRHLAAMGEPSLSCETTDRVFRVTRLRPSAHPVAIRAIDKGDVFTLVAVELDGNPDFTPGKILDRKEVALSEEDIENLWSAIEAAGFWELPTNERRGVRDGNVMIYDSDGAMWILEAADAGQYHVVCRGSLGSEPVRGIAALFLRLARLGSGEEEDY
jgi:hypothetical protein